MKNFDNIEIWWQLDHARSALSDYDYRCELWGEHSGKAFYYYKLATSACQSAIASIQKISPKTWDMANSLGECYFNLGKLWLSHGLYSSAKSAFQNAINEFESIPVAKRTHFNHEEQSRQGLHDASRAEYKSQHGFFSTLKKYGLFGAPTDVEKPAAEKVPQMANYSALKP